MDFEDLIRWIILILIFGGPILGRILKSLQGARPPVQRPPRQAPSAPPFPPEPRDAQTGLPLDPLSPPEPAGTPKGRDLLRRLEEEFFGGAETRPAAEAPPPASVPPAPAPGPEPGAAAAAMAPARQLRGLPTDGPRLRSLETPLSDSMEAEIGEEADEILVQKPSRAARLLRAHGKDGLRHAIILTTILDPPPGLSRSGGPDLPSLKS